MGELDGIRNSFTGQWYKGNNVCWLSKIGEKMKLDEIKTKLNNYVGKSVLIKYNLGRNKYEEYEVKIKELYNNVFLVELENNINKEIKSFSYNDVITKTIKINF